jgi:7-cyano-7-deazaguanine synthase in queuosine biosynthesis
MASASPIKLKVRGDRAAIFIEGDLNQRLQLVLDSFLDDIAYLPDGRGLDLLRIAAGAYAIDRIVKRDYSNDDSGTRSFSVAVEVSDPDFWSQSGVTAQVEDTLEFLSGDFWHLRFEPCAQRNGGDGHQGRIPMRPIEADRLALFSGGLDSMAGLASQLVNGRDRYGLLTVGHHLALRKRCSGRVLKLQALIGTEPIPHAHIVLGLRQGKAVRLSKQERSQRSRAFLFCAFAAVMAKAHGMRKIDLFENGVGSINAPLMTGMMFGSLATRGCHPHFLNRMSQLCSNALDSEVCFCLPFARMTKGEMLSGVKGVGLDEWLQESHSCIHTSLRIPNIDHCGICPACIERRQAFAVAGVSERHSYKTDVLEDAPDRGSDAAYLRLYQEEAASWLARDRHTSFRMNAHLEMSGIEQSARVGIRQLWDRHSREILNTFSPTLQVGRAHQ